MGGTGAIHLSSVAHLRAFAARLWKDTLLPLPCIVEGHGIFAVLARSSNAKRRPPTNVGAGKPGLERRFAHYGLLYAEQFGERLFTMREQEDYETTEQGIEKGQSNRQVRLIFSSTSH